jgi:NADPH:quinone reductase-like Zn-dependent oxidoreductase
MVTPPAVLGSDVAGEIVEVGPDVKGYKKGDRMYSHHGGEI